MSAKIDFLSAILKKRRQRIVRLRSAIDIKSLREAAHKTRKESAPHRLRATLMGGESMNVIAEFKRSSPSKGMIREQAAPKEIAKQYVAGGACAISVLTEEDYFRGSLNDLREVRAAVGVPVLRKDFVVDEIQIYEAAEAGADAVLLIVRALDDDELLRFRRIIEDDLGMDALVEVHDEAEMRHAAACSATLIGVNNRNLDTFEVTLETSLKLFDHAPRGATLISESGLSTADDLSRLAARGYRGFLIGETLMRADDPRRALEELLDSACLHTANGAAMSLSEVQSQG